MYLFRQLLLMQEKLLDSLLFFWYQSLDLSLLQSSYFFLNCLIKQIRFCLAVQKSVLDFEVITFRPKFGVAILRKRLFNFSQALIKGSSFFFCFLRDSNHFVMLMTVDYTFRAQQFMIFFAKDIDLFLMLLAKRLRPWRTNADEVYEWVIDREIFDWSPKAYFFACEARYRFVLEAVADALMAESVAALK